MKRLLSIALLALCVGCSATGRLSVGLWGASVSYEWTVTPDDGEESEEADATERAEGRRDDGIR